MSSLSKVFAAAFVAAGLMVPAGAGAVDVENEDAKEHKVTLTEPGGKQEITLKPGEKKVDLCAICTVNVPGMQPVQASGLDRVIIRNGKLDKIEQ